MTYSRNGQIAHDTEVSKSTQKPTGGEIKVDGFQQVIDMLRTADPEFRDSLLRRLLKQDPKMGSQLLAALKKSPR
jgi:hypothetical protein